MKIFLVSLLTSLILNVRSQDIVFKYDKKFRAVAMAKSYKSFVAVIENTGELHLTITDNKSTDRFIIDSSWKIQQHMTTVRGAYAQFPYDRFNTLQLFAFGTKEYNVYNSIEKNFAINEINYNKQEEFAVSNFELKRKESIIASFTTNNIFCLVVADNNERLKFITNAKRGGIYFDTLYVNEPNMPILSNLENAPIIGPDERDLKKLLEKNKLYFSGDKVYLTLDRSDATYITEVDLRSGAIRHNKFAQQFRGSAPKDPKPERYNSFLMGNILVNGNLFNSGISLSFYDHEKGSLIKNYTVAKNDSINFCNGLILNKKDKPITSSEFIKKALSGDGLVLELSLKTHDQVEMIVKICDIKKPMNWGSGGGYRYSTIPGNTIQSPGGPVLLPSYNYYPGFNWMRGEDIIKSNASFKSVFKADNLEHIKNSDESKSTTELLEKELQELDENSAISIFRKKGILYMGFYDTKEDAYIIKRIGRK